MTGPLSRSANEIFTFFKALFKHFNVKIGFPVQETAPNMARAQRRSAHRLLVGAWLWLYVWMAPPSVGWRELVVVWRGRRGLHGLEVWNG